VKEHAATFLPNIAYVRKKRGAEGIAFINRYMSQKGVNITVEKIESMKLAEPVPLSIRAVFLEACLALFDGDLEKLKAMGRDAPSNSLIVKFFLKYFATPNSAINHISSLWREHYSIGRIEVLKNEKGEGILALYDFKVSKLLCHYLWGYFEGVGILTRAKNPVCKETKCVHEGAPYCEFLLRWEV